jgi:recombinational DNA repair protein (RecF pathway)
VLATAQGVRLGVSKLRYHTQDFAYGIFSLVRGKEMWRLTGAHEGEGANESEVTNETVTASDTQGDKNSENLLLRARVFALLRRLLHGEEANPELFAIIVAFENFIMNENNGGVLSGQSELVECLIVLRILHALGYVNAGENSQLLVFIQNSLIWNIDLIEKVGTSRSTIITAINKGIQASQL